MNRFVFALVLFFFASFPLLGWISEPGNEGFLLVLIPIAVTIFVISGSMYRTKTNLKIFSVLYLLASIGTAILLQRAPAGFSLDRLAAASLCMTAVLVVLAIVADVVSMGWEGNKAQ